MALALATVPVSAVIATQPAGPAVTFATLYSFCSQPSCTDGSGGGGQLIQATDGNLYGTTEQGGTGGTGQRGGTVFKITPGGTLSTLYSFCSESGCTDGKRPTGVIQATDGTLYGTTDQGGNHANFGTVFSVTLSGALSTLDTMSLNSRSPGPLIQGANGNLYGNSGGGAKLEGSIYEITPSGKLTIVYKFCSQSGCPDGQIPEGLIQATDGDFYGVTLEGGAGSNCSSACGTVFETTPKGALTTLHSFCLQSSCPDGQLPTVLIQAANGDFYGTTEEGGAGSNCSGIGGCGTVFKITASGTLTTLDSFCPVAGCAKGSFPNGLIQTSDGNFYGTTLYGGSTNCDSGCGTVFKITPSGTLTTLHSFCAQSGCLDGQFPAGLMQAPNGDLYGMTGSGGANGGGTIFSLSVGLGPFVETQTTSGEAGANVVILGTDLTGATGVTFDGTVATFTVVSASEITATVPTGATTGYVEVTTPGGTLKSNKKFHVKL
jgi:uncharacterized repeat protein (TIGR03803 family)